MTAAQVRRALKRGPRRSKAPRRKALTPKQRAKIFAKTAGTCHVCGIPLDGKWHADHVVAHLHGGATSFDNCLPICIVCNRLRWAYEPRVMQMVMRLGVYAKWEIRHNTRLGEQLVDLAVRRLARSKGRRRRA
jgi:5-methylcytosine-specific restriction endonuclease McrA